MADLLVPIVSLYIHANTILRFGVLGLFCEAQISSQEVFECLYFVGSARDMLKLRWYDQTFLNAFSKMHSLRSKVLARGNDPI